VRIVAPHHDSLAPALKTLFPIAPPIKGRRGARARPIGLED